MGIRRGRIELFHDDQLVVALPDLKIIARTLERFGVAPGPVDERPVLGLALIQGLANVDTAISELLNGGAGGIGPELARYRDERAAALAAAPGAFAAGAVSGAIAAGTVPGHRSARQALGDLRSRDPGQPGCGIRPNDPGRMPATAGAPDA